MTKKKTKIKRNIKLSTKLQRLASFTSKSLNKAYIDYKHSKKIKEKKELKLKELQINKVHEKIKDAQCTQCDYKCSNKGYLNKHIKQVHDKIKDVQ